MRDLQPLDECECKDILIAVGNLGKLVLQVADVELEAITLPYLKGEEVMVVFLQLSARGVLSEECFDYLLELVEGMGRHKVELI